MNRLYVSFMIAFLAFMTMQAQSIASANYDVVPLPSNIQLQREDGFLLTDGCVVCIVSEDAQMRHNAEMFCNDLRKDFNLSVSFSTTPIKGKTIELKQNVKIPHDEGYRLIVNKHGVRVEGKTPRGVFYGLQTLRKALAVQQENPQTFLLPAVVIEDAPRFDYRGMHLDVARHFFGVDFIKQYIDMLAMHHLNRFHWHLTDDQGWRIEIKSYPQLTGVGSRRDWTTLGRNSSANDGTPHGGFYTQDEIRDVVRYAADRYITIIPEIDMPGHMLAALTAYPGLGCTGGPYRVEGRWGVFDDILCAGKEETFLFVEGVLQEIIDLFPSDFIHIGGDEVPRTRWEQCHLCQKRIKEEHLVESNGQKPETRLQGYFTKRIEKFLNSHGRKLIGWDELLESEADTSATIMSWRGVEGGQEASKRGYHVIMAPVSHCYFNFYLVENHVWGEPFAFDAVTPIEKTYNFDPAPDSLGREACRHIIGAQGNLWTEYVLYATQAEYQVLPRMAALSEVLWMQPQKKAFKAWVNRQRRLSILYDKHGWQYARHIFN